MASVWGADRVGVRLSPFGTVNDSGEDDPLPLYTHAIRALDALGLAYLHLIESRESANDVVDGTKAPLSSERFRSVWPGILIAAGGFDGPSAEAALRCGHADAVAFGRHFIANPDLPHRLRTGGPLHPYDRTTFYGGAAVGYTDYPTLADLEDEVSA